MSQRDSTKRSWRKRLLITGLVLFTLYLGLGIWAVPAIMISQIQSKGSDAIGREIVVERATFNPFSLEAKLYGVTVGPGNGETGNLLEIGKLSANPQLSSVFGTITVKSVEVSDADLWVAVDPSGAFSFQDILEHQAAAPEPAEPSSGEIPAAVVKSLLLSNLNFHYKDSSLATPYEETLTIERFAGRDLGTVEKRRIVETDMGEPGLHWDFDGLLKTASGASLNLNGGAESLSPWRFRLDTELVGFPLESIQPYVSESVVAELAGTFGFKLRETIELADAGPAIRIDGVLGLDAFSLADDEQTFAKWEALRLSGIEVDAGNMTMTVDDIGLDAPEFEAVLLADGSPRLPEMKATGSGSTPAAEGESEAKDFSASLGSVVVSRGRIAVEDRSLPSPFETNLDEIELQLSNLTASQVGGAFDASGALSLVLGVLDGTLELSAGLESLHGHTEASLALNDLNLQQLQPYVAQYANAELEGGSFGLNLDVTMQGMESPRLKGAMQLAGLRVVDPATKKEVFTMANLEVDGVDFHDESVEIENVTLVEPIIAAWQDEAGINLSRIAKLEAEVEQRTEELEQETGVDYFLKRLELKSASVGFVDTTLISTHNSRVSAFDLVLENVSTDPEKNANFDFGGVIDGSARIAGKGAVNIADPGKHLDLDMSFRGYDLTSTSPYWATYLGRKLSKGQFEILSKYEVRDNQLKGTNDFKIDQLTLGDPVESERAMNLPLGFAINLMRDPSGMISYNGLVVEGDLSDPQVKPWGLIGKAVRNLILNAVASPLKFLAKIAGGREDLDAISFAVSEIELDPEGLGKVEALRKLMVSRPGLRLDVSFLPNPAEAAYLKEQYRLQHLVNPEFQVISGLDLLRPIDPAALEAAVRSRYATLASEGVESATDPSEPASTETTTQAAETETAKPEGEVGIVKRLASLVGLRKRDRGEPDGATEALPASPDATAGAPVEDIEAMEGVSLDVMLTAVLESLPAVDMDENWMNDIAKQRIQNFKTALLEDGTVDANRVFSSELDETQAKGELGSILIRLTD